MNQKTISRTCVAIVALTMACASMSQISKTGNKYFMRMAYKPGAVMKYTMNSVSTVPIGKQTQKLNLSIPLVVKVLSVSAGVGTVEYTLGPGSMNGKPAGQGPQTATVKMDPRGQAVEGAAPGGIGNIGLPEKAVKIGDSWKANVTSAMGPAAGSKVNATYKLMGFRSVGGKQFAVVSTNAKAVGQGFTTAGNGTLLLNMADGWMHSMNMVLTITIKSADGKAMNTTSTIKVTRNS